MTDDKTDTTQKRRRELLKALGGTAAVGGLGGCLRFISGGNSTATPTAGAGTDTASGGDGASDGGDGTRTPTASGDGGDGTRTPTASGDGGDGGDSTQTATDSGGGDGGDSTETPTQTATPSGKGGNCILNADRSPDCSSPTEISSNITSDTTLGSKCDYVKVTGDIDIKDGATLTIEPGTTLEFDQNKRMKVDGSGAINAVGSCKEPIVFTGVQNTPGYWRGLGFQGADKTQSKLEYVLVEAGGSSDYYHANAPANITVMKGSKLAVNNSVIRNAAGYGAFFSGDATIDSFDGNVVTGNSDGAAYVWGSSAHYLSDSGTYTGNDNDYVNVAGNTIGSDMEVTWDAIDVPYRVFPDNTVEVQGHLTVAPGTTVEFEQTAQLNVEGGGPGRFTADGSKNAKITFTGTQDTKGYWRGIKFQNTKRTENTLNHCVIENAGSSDFYHANQPANVAVLKGSRLTVSNTTFRKSAGYGIYLSGGENVPTFENNTLTKNESGAAYVWASSAHYLSDSCTYTGNTDEYVNVAGNTIGSDAEVTWDAIDVPYRVFSDNKIEVQGHLTIAPGATVEFGQNAQLNVEGNGPGRLTAEGTSSDKITFTGAQKTKGFWKGIKYQGTNRVENKIVHCVVEYGGSTDFYHANDPANLAVLKNARLTLKNSTLANSGGYGLEVRSQNVTRSNNTYTNNASGGVSTD